MQGARNHSAAIDGIRHFCYSAAWKKLEPLWDLVIRARRVSSVLPLLEALLAANADLDPDAALPATASGRPGSLHRAGVSEGTALP